MSGSLQIDAGNSAVKWRRVVNGQSLAEGRCDLREADGLRPLMSEAQRVDEVWISSVLSDAHEERLRNNLPDDLPTFVAASEARCAGVTNSYEDPGSMGVDRWLTLLAARRRFSGRVCVVDAGTALTIDLLGADGVHEGGYIIAGRELMQAALFAGTARVRGADPGWSVAPGTSTASAVNGGATLALAGALREALRRAGDPEPRLLVTGGDGAALVDVAGFAAERADDLVFEGLEIARFARPGA
ncbi:MAG: type III pantothenate kinase [Pseudomonadota bacterium]